MGGLVRLEREVLRLREPASLSLSEPEPFPDGVDGREMAKSVEDLRMAPPMREDHLGLGEGELLIVVYDRRAQAR